jgi:hypothetical protein
MKTAAIPALAMLLMGTATAAQTTEAPAATDPAAAAPAPADPAAPAQQASYSDAQVDSFAQAVVKVQEIQTDATLAQDQKQEAMVTAVQEAGLDPQTYNSMSQAAKADQALLERIQIAVTEHRASQPVNQ